MVKRECRSSEIAQQEFSMSQHPTLVFLHGVGSGDLKDTWMGELEKALIELGYPSLDAVNVIAPKYPNALRGADDTLPLPPITIEAPGGDAAMKHRREFDRRMGAIEVALGRHSPGAGLAGGDAVVDVAMTQKAFRQARNYATKPRIRAQVLTRVLSQLPTSGRVVIVAHSLGSVIAADVLRRLPVGIEVVGMVTIGSPLANRNFHVDRLKSNLTEPPTNLAWWMNFWNQADPVTGHRGVSSLVRWLIDRRIQSGVNLDVHYATTYLGHAEVATAIGLAVFGSSSKELVQVETGVDIPLDYAETLALIALRYGHLMAARLDGERRVRFDEALRQVQAATVARIRTRNVEANRPTPSLIAAAAVDLLDPTAITPEPRPITNVSKSEAVIPLLCLALENVIRPFEIALPKGAEKRAMEDLTLEMGLGSQIGIDVFRAMEQSRDALKDGVGLGWIKWVALGVGAAALVVATAGLALAAAPGVAGAAAITSALAAFGPGGMIGGLLTAGTLATAGGGGIALGLANAGTSAAAVEAVVGMQLSACILRQLQGIEQDLAIWSSLVETESELRRRRERVVTISDKSAPLVKELDRKIEVVVRALEYLNKQGLGPNISLDDDETSDTTS